MAIAGRNRHEQAETSSKMDRGEAAQDRLGDAPVGSEAGVRWLRRLGLKIELDSVVITAGALHALDIILAALTKPGDLVFADELIYPGLMSVARHRHLRLQGIAMDDVGMDADALRTACRQRKTQFLYYVPTLHIPTSAVLTAERRCKLVEIAKEYDLLITEDDVHRPLMEEAPPPLANLAPGRCFFIASTSKVIAGGLRVAFVAAPGFAQELLKESIWASMVMVAPLTVELATLWIEGGTADQTVESECCLECGLDHQRGQIASRWRGRASGKGLYPRHHEDRAADLREPFSTRFYLVGHAPATNRGPQPLRSF